jgi:hypothetical protein
MIAEYAEKMPNKKFPNIPKSSLVGIWGYSF